MKLINSIFKNKKLPEYIIPTYKMKNGKFFCIRGLCEDYMPLSVEINKSTIEKQYREVGEYNPQKGTVGYFN
jgi:hypothetical protein